MPARSSCTLRLLAPACTIGAIVVLGGDFAATLVAAALPFDPAVVKGSKFDLTMTTDGGTKTLTNAVDCSPTISPVYTLLTGDGGPVPLTIAMLGTCAWTISGLPSWLSDTTTIAGQGPQTLTLTAQPNPSTTESRLANLTFASLTTTLGTSIEQNRACTYFLGVASLPGTSSNTGRVRKAGGTGTVQMSPSNTECAWAVTSNVDWIRITTPASGTDGATVGFTLAANPDLADRTGTITVKSPATGRSATLTITQTGQPALPEITQQPVNQTVSPGQDAVFSVAAIGEPPLLYFWEMSNDGLIWSGVPEGTTINGTHTGTLTTTMTVVQPTVALSGRRYRVKVTNGNVNAGSGAATSNTVFLTVSLPSMSIDRPSVQFGASNTGSSFATQTPGQLVRLSQNGVGSVSWTATASQPWITVTPASGTGSTILTIGVKFAAGLLLSGRHNGTVTFTLTGAVGTVGPLSVGLNTVAASATTPPTGAVDTPLDGATGVTGSIAVSGWTLDDMGVTRVRVMREPVTGEGTNLVFVGDAVLVDGARPDVAGVNPTVPYFTRAGWGYLMLTNFLPFQGNGTFRLHILADDIDGHSTELGARTITCVNNSSTKPFGAIDTPNQGEIISGSNYANFGWVLNRGSSRADPPGGGTVRVLLDGVFQIPTPQGWVARSDLTTLFPENQFSGVRNALGVWGLDTTALANGVHSIAWVATATNGQTDGIGSRFFTVANSTSALESPGLVTAAGAEARTAASFVADSPSLLLSAGGGAAGSIDLEVNGARLDSAPIQGRGGLDPDASYETISTATDGVPTLLGKEMDRFELLTADPGRARAAHETITGYMRTDRGLAPLPVGSHLDPDTGAFTWQPPAGFIYGYDLVFVRWVDGAAVSRREVRVLISPRSQ